MAKIKLPNTFRTNKELNEEELDEIVKKTLVDKVLVEMISKEIGEKLENKQLSEKLKVEFKKTFYLKENEDIERVVEFNEDKSEKDIYASKSDLHIQETNQILEELLKLEKDVKEEEIVHTYNNTFNLITDKVVYKFWLISKEKSSDKTTEVSETDKIGTFKKKKITNIYHNPTVEGYVKYAKFNKEHNEKIIQILKEKGYNVTVQIED